MIRGIQDSRGTMRPVYPVAASWVEKPTGPPTRPAGGYIKSVVLAALFIGALLVLATFRSHPLLIAVGIPCIFALVLLTTWLTDNVRRPAPTYESFGALLAHGYCPSCGYRIDDFRPEPDGCTVCPECGAAWRR